MKKVALALSLITGDQTERWVRDMVRWLEEIDLALNNVPTIWDQFVNAFTEQFMDTQKQNRAKTQLDRWKMTGNNIDEYISKFKELARITNYTIGNEETVNLFLKGLTKPIIQDLMKPPFLVRYL